MNRADRPGVGPGRPQKRALRLTRAECNNSKAQKRLPAFGDG